MAKDNVDGSDEIDSPMRQESENQSMRLAIGSTFKCRFWMEDGRAVMEAPASVLCKQSVVQMMDSIRSVAANTVPDRKKNMEHLFRVESVTEDKGRLWAILDLNGFTAQEVKLVTAVASGMSEEMYAPTPPEIIANFAEQVSLQALDSDVDGLESDSRALGDHRPEDDLPPHLAKLASSCETPQDAINAIRTVVSKGQIMAVELSKSKHMENFDLRCGDEKLMRKETMPLRQQIVKSRTRLKPQTALLAAVNFEKLKLTLLLEEKGGRTCQLGYNDAEHGRAIGEALAQAHNGRNSGVPQVDRSTGLVRVEVVLIEEHGGDQNKYYLHSIRPV
ncbi:hypothetical protein [Polaromonas sp. AET17H-212]|uniref:hypothetical protein n=1 Tax=Polaromonas sp. AET17H-212 TaxID=1977061 RepID=UPI0011420617|nr:hypothetical protein [Polaromonas sp. AET17H-212]